MKCRREKQIFSGGWVQWEVGGHKERENEGEYGGCTLYPYMKIEELNCSKKGAKEKKEKNGGGKSKIHCKHIVNVYPCITILC
jgi:hypothetical protein